MGSMKERLTGRLNDRLDRNSVEVLRNAFAAALLKNQQIIIDTAAATAATGGDVDFIREQIRKVDNMRTEGNSVIFSNLVHERDALFRALTDAYDIHLQEHRADVSEKWRALIFHTATAIGYAAVVLLTIYMAHDVLQIPVPLTRIPF